MACHSPSPTSPIILRRPVRQRLNFLLQDIRPLLGINWTFNEEAVNSILNASTQGRDIAPWPLQPQQVAKNFNTKTSLLGEYSHLGIRFLLEENHKNGSKMIHGQVEAAAPDKKERKKSRPSSNLHNELLFQSEKQLKATKSIAPTKETPRYHTLYSSPSFGNSDPPKLLSSTYAFKSGAKGMHKMVSARDGRGYGRFIKDDKFDPFSTWTMIADISKDGRTYVDRIKDINDLGNPDLGRDSILSLDDLYLPLAVLQENGITLPPWDEPHSKVIKG